MKKRAFTLIELLIVVLIIGVLTSVALPMYQKAVDKSRYATLMPMAKSVHDAQETYLMANGSYSKDLSKLDTRIPGDPTGASASFADGITAEISTADDYGYVKMSKTGLNNNYVLYQNKSRNFPGEIHCEALNDNNRAQELCKSLGGQYIGGSLTDGYTTYVLEGTGSGNPMPHGPVSYPCTKYQGANSCSQYQNEDGSFREESDEGDYKRVSLYDENGSYLADEYIHNDWENVALQPGDGSFLRLRNENGVITELNTLERNATSPISGSRGADISLLYDSDGTPLYEVRYDGGNESWTYRADGSLKHVYFSNNYGYFTNSFDENGNLTNSSMNVNPNPYNSEWDGDMYWDYENNANELYMMQGAGYPGNDNITLYSIDEYKAQYCAAVSSSQASFCK